MYCSKCSRKWKREEQKAALMSRTLFGGMATQALSYLGKNNPNPYQQHLSMDDRLRWAQCNEASMGGNIYVVNRYNLIEHTISSIYVMSSSYTISIRVKTIVFLLAK